MTVASDDPRVSGRPDTPLMPCGCDAGERLQVVLIGDGQPGVPCRLEERREPCPYCGGSGVLEDPEYEGSRHP